MAYLWTRPHETGDGTSCGRVTARTVDLWLDTGNPHTECGTSCTHAEFLAGAWHDTVRSTLGPDALPQMLAVVRGAADDPMFAAEFRVLGEVRAIIAAIPHDPTLPSLLSREDLAFGAWACAQGVLIPARPGGESIGFDRDSVTLSATNLPPVRVPFGLPLRGYVFAAGVWVIHGDQLVALDARGRARAPAFLASPPWTTLLRPWEVYAVDGRALVVLQWRHPTDGACMVCEFRPDEGLVGRASLESPPPPRDLPASWQAPFDRHLD